jgi:hypothetical protein
MANHGTGWQLHDVTFPAFAKPLLWDNFSERTGFTNIHEMKFWLV